MADSDKKKVLKHDPTEAPSFKRVVKHFLTTPPKPHTKGKRNSGDDSAKGEAKRSKERR